MRYIITMTVDIVEVQEPQKDRKPQKSTEITTSNFELPAKKAAMTPLLFGIKDAAKMLGVSRSSIYVLLKEGKLAPVKIGRRVLFKEQDLRDLVINNSGNPCR